MLQDCPIPIVGTFEISGKTFSDIEEMCKLATENENYDFYEFVAYSNRVKDIVGGFAVDTTNRIVYVYGEFTANGNVGSTSDYRSLLLSAPTLAGSFLTRVAGSGSEATRINTDTEKSDAYKNFNCAPSSSVIYVNLDYGQLINDNEKYVIYGFWQY